MGKYQDEMGKYSESAVRQASLKSPVPTLQRTNTENYKQIFPKQELCGHSPYFHIHVPVSDLYIPIIDLPIQLQEICGPTLGIYVWIAHGHMNVEIGTEAAQFPGKKNRKEIFLAVQLYSEIWTTHVSRVGNGISFRKNSAE